MNASVLGADGILRWRPVRELNSEAVVPVAVSEDGNWIRLSNDTVLERVPRSWVRNGDPENPCQGCYYRSSHVTPFLQLGDVEAAALATGDDRVRRYCAEALGLPPCAPGKPFVTGEGTTMSGVVFKKTPQQYAVKILARHFHG